MLRLRLFQSFEVVVDHQIVHLGPQRRRFLAYLVLNAGHALAGRLSETPWPDETDDTKLNDNVNHACHRMGRSLGAETHRLRGETGAICFDATGADVDVLHFQELATRDDMTSLEEAARLYRGELLAEWEELWLDPKRIELENQYRDVLQRLVVAAFRVKTIVKRLTRCCRMACLVLNGPGNSGASAFDGG